MMTLEEYQYYDSHLAELTDEEIEKFNEEIGELPPEKIVEYVAYTRLTNPDYFKNLD